MMYLMWGPYPAFYHLDYFRVFAGAAGRLRSAADGFVFQLRRR